MPSILITGVNRGLGFELARQYADDGWRVFGTCRDTAAGKPLLDAVAAAPGKLSLHALEVRDFGQIDALATSLAGEAIDVLLNNAGIMENREKYPLEKLDYALWEDVLRTNTLAPVKMAAAFADHVARSARKIIVTLTSSLGSLTMNEMGGAPFGCGGNYMYRTSKAALHMATRNLALDLKPRGITVAVISPGNVRTEMGGPNAPLGPEESITGVRKVIAGLNIGKSGKFFYVDGRALPW